MAMPSKSAISGKHYRSESPVGRPTITRVVIVLAIAFVSTGCSSEATKRRNATCEYWAGLSRICNQFIAASQGLDKAKTPEETIESVAKVKKLYSNMSDDIAQLPSSFVDADVVAFGADYIQAINEVSIVSQDMGDLLKRQSQLQNAAGSASVAVESFVRGFMGDPLGKVREFTSASQNLAGEGARLQSRWASIQQRIAAFDAREVRLRSALSEKYRRDFPPLTPPHNPD